MNHNARAAHSSTPRKDGGNQVGVSITKENTMNNAIRNATLGLVALICITGTSTAGIEVLYEGIEVLGIEVLQSGAERVIIATDAQPGCTVWAIMNVDGQDIVCDIKTVDGSGFNAVEFFASHPNNRIQLVAQDGIEVLAVLYTVGYEDELILQ
jgi:hypothetical protein